MTLWDMDINSIGEVTRINETLEESIHNRLREIGLEKGQNITLLRKALAGGPIVFQVADGVFSLEKNIATQIFISQNS